ncbi:hypothetical protein [Microbacterium terricola]|nr:hypothetical protein [Microbacterium terricola]UYK39875.1 hypothetical protein OAU46_14440 [Microbacterium terricola]
MGIDQAIEDGFEDWATKYPEIDGAYAKSGKLIITVGTRDDRLEGIRKYVSGESGLPEVFVDVRYFDGDLETQ